MEKVLQNKSAITLLLLRIPILSTLAKFFYQLTRVEKLSNHIVDLQTKLVSQQNEIGLLKNKLNDVSCQLANLETHPVSSSHSPVVTNSESENAHQYDLYYYEFENRFRGPRSAVKDRLRLYFDTLDFRGAGKAPVLDIGCGRGEWLELLTEQQIPCRGIDLNRMMIKDCLAHDFKVEEADALHALRRLESESLGVVTAFHFVEHVPFKNLMAIFAECLRVLKRGGFVLFETPNPENLLVGSCSFYTDATHLAPLPPSSLSFMLEQSGFEKLQVLRLAPLKENLHIENERAELAEVIKRFYTFQDYAIVAYKS